MGKIAETYHDWVEKHPFAETYEISTKEFETLLSELEQAQQDLKVANDTNKRLNDKNLAFVKREQKLIEGLRYYADTNHYVYNAEHGYIIKNMDNGRNARIVLTELGVTK